MITEEIFLITFALNASNLNYDDYDNPKIEMIKMIMTKGLSSIVDCVYKQILDIPNSTMKEHIINFLFKLFIINCDDKNKILYYIAMDENIVYKNFLNDQKFAHLLLNTYYSSCIRDYSKNIINIPNKNDVCHTIVKVESLNNKLKQCFVNVYEDFILKCTDIFLIYDIYKRVIIFNGPIKNEEKFDCYQDLEFLRTYRIQFVKMMFNEIYEDIMFSRSDEAKIYNDSLWDDDEYFESPGYIMENEEENVLYFEDIIIDIIEENKVFYSLPDEFYEDLFETYQNLMDLPEKRRTNREYMKKNHQKTLKRINPLYELDEI